MIAVADHLSAAKPTSLRKKKNQRSPCGVADYYICNGTKPTRVWVLLQQGGQIRRYYDCLDHRKNPHRPM